MTKKERPEFHRWLLYTVCFSSLPLFANFALQLIRWQFDWVRVFESAALLFLAVVVCGTVLEKLVRVSRIISGTFTDWLIGLYLVVSAFFAVLVGGLESFRAAGSLSRTESGKLMIAYILPNTSFQYLCIGIVGVLLAASGALYYVLDLIERGTIGEERRRGPR